MTTRHLMIDLYVPASAGTVAEVQAAASGKGLEGFVYVAHHPEELPTPDEWSDEEGQPLVLLGCTLSGAGYRIVVLVDDWEDANFDVLEATDDLNLLVAAVGEMNGVAYSVCPHQTNEGEVVRQANRLPSGTKAGVVAMAADTSHMARDLDIEQAARAERRILGGTGPFGNIEHVGRYATLLATNSADGPGVIKSIHEGLGVAAEIGDHRPPKEERGRGRRRSGEGDGDGDPKRRRRRRRGGSGGESSGGGDASGSGSSGGGRGSSGGGRGRGRGRSGSGEGSKES